MSFDSRFYEKILTLLTQHNQCYFGLTVLITISTKQQLQRGTHTVKKETDKNTHFPAHIALVKQYTYSYTIDATLKQYNN